MALLETPAKTVMSRYMNFPIIVAQIHLTGMAKFRATPTDGLVLEIDLR